MVVDLWIHGGIGIYAGHHPGHSATPPFGREKCRTRLCTAFIPKVGTSAVQRFTTLNTSFRSFPRP